MIDTIHATKRTSVVAVESMEEELARNRDIICYAVRCSNFGMLYSYRTVIHAEESP